MAAPTLEDVFGIGATQDVNTVTIQKSALQQVGLTAAANNSAEAILVCIFMIAKEKLTETNRATDLVNRKTSLTYSGQDLIEQSSNVYLRDAFTFLLYKLTQLQVIDPNNY